MEVDGERGGRMGVEQDVLEDRHVTGGLVVGKLDPIERDAGGEQRRMREAGEPHGVAREREAVVLRIAFEVLGEQDAVERRVRPQGLAVVRARIVCDQPDLVTGGGQRARRLDDVGADPAAVEAGDLGADVADPHASARAEQPRRPCRTLPRTDTNGTTESRGAPV